MLKETQLQKNFNTGNFQIGASVFKQFLWYFCSLFFFKSQLIPFSSVLVFTLRLFGAKIGKEVRVKPGIHIYYPWKLTIGDYSWLAACKIENLAQVNIGKNVCVSQYAILLTGNHDYKKSTFDLITKPITLADGTWIGAGAIICPGVTAESHSVLTVGSIATKDLDAYAVYQGNPAVKVRDREIV